MTWDEGTETGEPCGCFTCQVLHGPRGRPGPHLTEWRANIREAIQHGAAAHGELARRVIPPLQFRSLHDEREAA